MANSQSVGCRWVGVIVALGFIPVGHAVGVVTQSGLGDSVKSIVTAFLVCFGSLTVKVAEDFMRRVVPPALPTCIKWMERLWPLGTSGTLITKGGSSGDGGSVDASDDDDVVAAAALIVILAIPPPWTTVVLRESV